MKRLFTNKVKSHRTMNLVEKDKLTNDDEEIAKMFNEYFVNIVQELDIVIEKSNAKLIQPYLDEVNMAIIKYKNHQSIKAIIRVEWWN